MRWFVWFIIITVNIVLGSNGVIQWVQCWPIKKLWNWDMEGSCLPPKTVQNYNTFIAGEWKCCSRSYRRGRLPETDGQHC